jgi:hypothetical protein
VSDHHGTISVSSEEDHGTTFRIDLPQRQSGVVRKPAIEEKKSDTEEAAKAAFANEG